MIEIYFDGTLLPDENYISFDYSYKQFEDEFFLGSVASVQAKLQIPKTALPSTLTNVLVKIDHADYLYLVVDEIKDEDDAICTLSLSDKLSNADVPYDIQSVIPITAKNLLIKICTDFNIPHDTFNFTGQDKIIASHDNTLTARNYIEQIAENAFGYAIINKYGKLEIKTYKQEPTVHNRITAGDLDTYKLGDKITIERVVYEFGAIKYDTSDTHDTSLYTLVMDSNNMFLQTLTEAEFKAAANNILGFSFYNIKIDTTNILYRDSEILYFVDTNNVEYRILNQRESSYAGGFISTYETEINNTKQEFTKIINPSEKIKRLKQIVDQEANTITIIANSVDSISKPLNTIEGNNLHFEDGLNTEIVDLTIEGKSEQDTRSGKNLLNTSGLVSQTKNGITLTKNKDGSLTFNGTATATTYFNFDNLVLAGGTYTFSGLTNGSNTTIFMKLTIGGSSKIIYTTPTTFTLNDTATATERFISIVNGAVINNITIYPMIESGSIATEYEPYGVSPSPEFPSEIRSVGYENIFDLNSVYYTDNCILNDDNTITYKGWATTFITTTNTSKMFKPNTTYTFSFDATVLVKSANITQTQNLFLLYKDGTETKQLSNLRIESMQEGQTYHSTAKFTTPADLTGFRIFSYTSYPSPFSEIKLSNIQLEEGTIAHPYIQSGKYGIEYKQIGKNLFDESLNLHYSTNASGVTTTNNYYISTDYLPCNSGDKYGISCIVKGTTDFNIKIVFFDADKNFISRPIAEIGTINNKIFKTTIAPTNAKYVMAQFQTIGEQKMFYKSDKELSYEEYKEDKHLFILDEPLRSIGDVKDIAIIKNNKLEIIRNIGSIILNGSENWSIFGTGTANWFYYYDAHLNVPNVSNAISTHYKYASMSSTSKNNFVIIPSGLIRTKHETEDTITNYKTWLSNNHVQIDYLLGESSYETYDEVPTPNTFKGTNNITINDELKPNLRLTYVRDTSINSYVEGQIQSEKIIRTERISELQLADEQILARVGTLEEDYTGIEGRISSNEATLEKINKSFDDDGNVIAVRVQQGMKFDSEGLDFYTSDNSLNTLIRNDGVYFKDGNDTVAECKKDGFMAIDLKQKGQHFYSWNGTGYDFVDERIEVDGDNCYATFYEGGD